MPESPNSAFAMILLFLIMITGCSRSPPAAATPPGRIQSNGIPASGVDAGRTAGAIQAPRSELPLALLKQRQWAEFYRQLDGYLAAKPKATEETDRQLLEASNAILTALPNSDEFNYVDGRTMFEWRVMTFRLILSKYQPLSTEVGYWLCGRLASQREFYQTARQAPDTEHRLSDARLMLRELKRISDIIDPQFDPEDLRNWPMLSVGIPGGGGRYQPGTNPEDVQEPEIRENYKKAIRENEAKSEKIITQRTAKDLEKQLRSAIVTFVRQAYGAPPAAMSELSDLLKELGINEARQTQIVDEAAAMFRQVEKPVGHSGSGLKN